MTKEGTAAIGFASMKKLRKLPLTWKYLLNFLQQVIIYRSFYVKFCLFSYGPTSVLSPGKRTHNYRMNEKGLGRDAKKQTTVSAYIFWTLRQPSSGEADWRIHIW